MDYNTIKTQLCFKPQFQLLSRKDIINFRNQFMLSRSFYPNNYQSVKIWITRAKQIVRFYKLPDEACSENFDLENFVLIFVTDEQVFIIT